MINYIIIGIILIILVSASIYIYKEKKSGKNVLVVQKVVLAQ